MKESETVELKKSTSEVKEALKSIVAILNKYQKGEVWFGIKNDGTVVGQDVSEKTIREISKAISDHIEPKIFPKINEVTFTGKKCVHIEFSGNNIAFREAIVNAYCHRDYYEYDSINVAIFKNRVEIRSPGELYGGLTIEEIKKKMVSRRRNEFIAQMFHEVHFVEKWGRGISLILSKEPDADFEIVAGIFITTFKRETREVVKREWLVEGLVENQKKILNFMTKNPRISKREMAEKIGISTTAIDKNINTLKKKGLLKRVGGSKIGHWEVIS